MHACVRAQPPLRVTARLRCPFCCLSASRPPGALRFGYFYGGDGEALMRLDVRNLAGFVRDRAALITNWLLPLPSARLELRSKAPLVEEHRMLLPVLL